MHLTSSRQNLEWTPTQNLLSPLNLRTLRPKTRVTPIICSRCNENSRGMLSASTASSSDSRSSTGLLISHGNRFPFAQFAFLPQSTQFPDPVSAIAQILRLWYSNSDATLQSSANMPFHIVHPFNQFVFLRRSKEFATFASQIALVCST